MFQRVQGDKQLKPVGNLWRFLCSAKRSYNSTSKKCLAALWSVLVLCPYLEKVCLCGSHGSPSGDVDAEL